MAGSGVRPSGREGAADFSSSSALVTRAQSFAFFVETGAPMTVAQAQSGYAHTRVTLGIYSDLIGESHRNAAGKIAMVLDPSGPQQKSIGKWIR